MPTAQPTVGDRVRLHITPFNRDLLDKILPLSLRSHASDISFHEIQTFPERGFGYVELPEMEARNLRKKFNGAILKGSKVRVEEAKPVRKRKSDQLETVDDSKAVKKPKKEKRKVEDGVLSGHELEKGRIVKRGWAEGAKPARNNKSDKKLEKSVSLKDKKMRFKTSLPSIAAVVDTKLKKKSKRDQEGTTKNSKAATYEDGKGWLDADGNVIEAEPASQKRRRNRAPSSPTPGGLDDLESHVRGVSKLDLNSNDNLGLESPHRETSASSEAESDAESEPESESASSPSLSESGSEQDSSSSSPADQSPSGRSSITSDVGTPAKISGESQSTAKEIHPLEALYKRPKAMSDDATLIKRPAPIDTSFSFFGSGEVDEHSADDNDQPLPQPPHTKRDFEWRSIRSAAPTPDTALPGKRFNFSLTTDEDDEDEDDHADRDATNTANPRSSADLDAANHKVTDGQVGEREEESEFRKWFYDNRGDLNRGWKKRRREEKKLQRQRDNRRMSRRVA